jgi:RNA polymerase sigma-70 factor (ECF subfamily)
MTSLKEFNFTSSFREVKTRLLNRLLANAVNPEDAEDILQRAVLKMWEKYDSFSQGSSFIAWAWTIAKHTMLNFIRARKRSVVNYGEKLPEYFDELFAPEKQINDPRIVHMEDLLNKLSTRERKLLHAVYVEGKKIKDYAKENKLSSRTCFNTISLVRRKLKEQINERILLEMH